MANKSVRTRRTFVTASAVRRRDVREFGPTSSRRMGQCSAHCPGVVGNTSVWACASGPAVSKRCISIPNRSSPSRINSTSDSPRWVTRSHGFATKSQSCAASSGTMNPNRFGRRSNHLHNRRHRIVRRKASIGTLHVSPSRSIKRDRPRLERVSRRSLMRTAVERGGTRFRY
jgi:hypothetical protein